MPGAVRTVSYLIAKATDDTPVGISLVTKSGILYCGALKPGLPAAESGVREGDVVIAVNGQETTSASLGATILKTAPAGFVEIVVKTTAPPQPVFGIPLSRLPASEADPLTECEKGLELSCLEKQIAIIEGSELKLTAPPPADDTVVKPFDKEMQSLRDMGLAADDELALAALKAANGDVQTAIEKLLVELT